MGKQPYAQSYAHLERWQRLLMASGATHCGRGHEFTLENTKWQPSNRTRRCRACVRIMERQRKRS